ncbi:DHA2 family efflux MFS transporter permease subunit [Streptomyces sp. NPDC048191]|uniref:DHA2 family efflux MFS transporter permease subunit n=1 Tax=Streptomyces sp. NPDC048191 TaxID=3155484 RepID=UPI0033C919C7
MGLSEAGSVELSSVETQTPGPEAAGESTSDFEWTRKHTITLTVLCLAAFLDAIDITVVNVALPAIKSGLGFSQASLAWVVNAYLILFGGFLLLGGRVGDLLGRRRVFLWGVSAFTLASLGSGLAQNAATLTVTRGLQGLAGAFVAPMTLAILNGVFPEGKPRDKAFGIWGGITGVAGSVGLILGGLLGGGPSWRWLFYINIPIGVFMVIAALRFIPDDRARRVTDRTFDLVGAVTGTGGISLLCYAIAQVDQHPWGSGRTVSLLIGAALVLAYFVVHEARIASQPLVPLSLFANRSVLGANVVSALCGCAMFATFYLATLYQQQVLHFSALKTGLGFIPLTVLLLCAAPVGPKLVAKFGMRAVIAAGAVISAAGLGLFARISEHGSLLTDIILPSVVLSVGFGILFIPMTMAALNGVPEERSGVASAMVNMTRFVGGSVGLAVISTLATTRTDHLLEEGHPALESLNSGLQVGFAIAAGLMVLTMLAAVALFRGDGKAAAVSGTEPVPEAVGSN